MNSGVFAQIAVEACWAPNHLLNFGHEQLVLQQIYRYLRRGSLKKTQQYESNNTRSSVFLYLVVGADSGRAIQMAVSRNPGFVVIRHIQRRNDLKLIHDC